MSTKIPLIRFHISEAGEVQAEYLPLDPIDDCPGTVVDIVQVGSEAKSYHHSMIHAMLRFASGATEGEISPLLSVYATAHPPGYNKGTIYRGGKLVSDLASASSIHSSNPTKFLYYPVTADNTLSSIKPTWARGTVLTDRGILVSELSGSSFTVGTRNGNNLPIIGERGVSNLERLVSEAENFEDEHLPRRLENRRQSSRQKDMFSKVMDLAKKGESIEESSIAAALVLGPPCLLPGSRGGSRPQLEPAHAYKGVAAVYKGDEEQVTMLLGKSGKRWRAAVASLVYPGLEELLGEESYLHISKSSEEGDDLLSSVRYALSESVCMFESKLVDLTDSVDMLARHSSVYLKSLGMEDKKFSAHVESLPKPPHWYSHNQYKTGSPIQLEPPEGELVSASDELVVLPNGPAALRVAALSLLPKSELKAAVNRMSSMFLAALSEAKKDVELHENTINARTEQGRLLRDTLECISASKLKWYRKYPVAAYKDVFLALHKTVRVRATSSGSVLSRNTIKLIPESEPLTEQVTALGEVFGVKAECRVSRQGVRALGACVHELMPAKPHGHIRESLQLLKGLEIYLSTESENYHSWLEDENGRKPEEVECDILGASRMSIRAFPNSVYRHYIKNSGNPSVGVSQDNGHSSLRLAFFCGTVKGDKEVDLPFAGLLSVASWVLVDQDMGVDYAKAFREYAVVLRNLRLSANYRMLEPTLVEEATYANTLIEYLDRYLDSKS